MTSTEIQTEPTADASQVLTGEALNEALVKQVEFYFSRQNLSTDHYLVSQMNSQNYVPISVISNFKLVKALTQDVALITETLKSLSKTVEVDETGSMVRPVLNATLPVRNTLILRDIPPTTPVEDLKKLFEDSNTASPTNVRPDLGNTWFVTFSTEEEAVKAFECIRKKTFLDKPIQARIKSESVLKAFQQTDAPQQQADANSTQILGNVNNIPASGNFYQNKGGYNANNNTRQQGPYQQQQFQNWGANRNQGQQHFNGGRYNNRVARGGRRGDNTRNPNRNPNLNAQDSAEGTANTTTTTGENTQQNSFPQQQYQHRKQYYNNNNYGYNQNQQNTTTSSDTNNNQGQFYNNNYNNNFPQLNSSADSGDQNANPQQDQNAPNAPFDQQNMGQNGDRRGNRNVMGKKTRRGSNAKNSPLLTAAGNRQNVPALGLSDFPPLPMSKNDGKDFNGVYQGPYNHYTKQAIIDIIETISSETITKPDSLAALNDCAAVLDKPNAQLELRKPLPKDEAGVEQKTDAIKSFAEAAITAKDIKAPDARSRRGSKRSNRSGSVSAKAEQQEGSDAAAAQSDVATETTNANGEADNSKRRKQRKQSKADAKPQATAEKKEKERKSSSASNSAQPKGGKKGKEHPKQTFQPKKDQPLLAQQQQQQQQAQAQTQQDQTQQQQQEESSKKGTTYADVVSKKAKQSPITSPKSPAEDATNFEKASEGSENK